MATKNPLSMDINGGFEWENHRFRHREFSIATLPGRVAMTIPEGQVTPRHRASAEAPGSVATPGISARQPRASHPTCSGKRVILVIHGLKFMCINDLNDLNIYIYITLKSLCVHWHYHTLANTSHLKSSFLSTQEVAKSCGTVVASLVGQDIWSSQLVVDVCIPARDFQRLQSVVWWRRVCNFHVVLG